MCFNLPSNGSGIQFIGEFQRLWATLGKKSYVTMLDEETSVQGFLEEKHVTMLNFIQNVLKDESHKTKELNRSKMQKSRL